MAGRPYISVLVVISLLLLVALAPMAEAYTKLRPKDCKKKCTYRCSVTSHKKPCMFFCQKCCAKCLCVPRGVYGHKQECPCYNKWKTQEGKPKCP